MSDKQPIHPLLVGTTEGPWGATGDYGYADGIPFEGVVAVGGPYEGDRAICYVIGDPEDEMAKANAKLIAQAPSLAAENAALADRLKVAEAKLKEAARIISDLPHVTKHLHGVSHSCRKMQVEYWSADKEPCTCGRDAFLASLSTPDNP